MRLFRRNEKNDGRWHKLKDLQSNNYKNTASDDFKSNVKKQNNINETDGNNVANNNKNAYLNDAIYIIPINDVIQILASIEKHSRLILNKLYKLRNENRQKISVLEIQQIVSSLSKLQTKDSSDMSKDEPRSKGRTENIGKPSIRDGPAARTYAQLVLT